MDPRPGFGVRLIEAAEILARHDPVARVEREWPFGRVQLSAYLGACDLPTSIPGRVRCLVTDGSEVLVTRDRMGLADCFPGGGSEPGETIAQTAQREVFEETGWHVDAASIETIGWLHLQSLYDWNEELPFPYPDVFMTVVKARPSHYTPTHAGWVDTEGFVLASAFVSLDQVPREIADDPISVVFLRHEFGERWRSITRPKMTPTWPSQE